MSSQRSLTIISHTEHYKNVNGEIVGWEPTVREINHLSNIFDLVYHVAPFYSETPHKANAPYTSDKIKYIPIRPTGGQGILKKLGILVYMPLIMVKIIKIINKTDWVHFRAPTNLGIFVLPLLSLYKYKKKWVKYAGNWKQKNIPLSYLWQRWWLRNNFHQSIVTINGSWKNQEQHLISFQNPCINDVELDQAAEVGSEKDFSGKLNLCFIGRIDNNKGVIKVLSALSNLNTLSRIKEINIAGGIDDSKTEAYINSNMKKTNKIKINFLGWISRIKLNKIYEKSHILILPTQSEGFPKVIAEAASYGCIPMVTNISPINQYIEHGNNGLLLDNPSINNIQDCILKVDKGVFNLKDISTATMNGASQFTFSHYISRIQSEIIYD